MLGAGLRGTGGSPPPTMRAILNIGLQHRSFTSSAPIGSSSEKAFAPDFDCAWGERDEDSALKKWSVPKVRTSGPGRLRPGHGLGWLASGLTNREFRA